MLILRKEAEEDIRSAQAWYESQRENLGRAFVTEIDRTLESIREHPEAYPQYFKTARRVLCRRFPYAVYFVYDNSDIMILAVLHQRRHPATLRSRGR